MTLNIEGLTNAVVSHAMALGVFERVNSAPPANAPGNGLTYACWADRIRPSRSSGLSATSANVMFMARLYKPVESLPQDELDPDLVRALDVLLAAYCGDFDLGGLIRCVDIRGMDGTPLDVNAGWARFDEGPVYRVLDITLPLIINDAWEEQS